MKLTRRNLLKTTGGLAALVVLPKRGGGIQEPAPIPAKAVGVSGGGDEKGFFVAAGYFFKHSPPRWEKVKRRYEVDKTTCGMVFDVTVVVKTPHTATVTLWFENGDRMEYSAYGERLISGKGPEESEEAALRRMLIGEVLLYENSWSGDKYLGSRLTYPDHTFVFERREDW